MENGKPSWYSTMKASVQSLRGSGTSPQPANRLGESHGMRPTLLVITVGLSALKSTTELEKARGLAWILLIRGANPAVRLRVIERPVHPLFHFGDELRIASEISERYQ